MSRFQANLVEKNLGFDDRRLKVAKQELGRFSRFCSELRTTQDQPLKLEPFQRMILLAYFAGLSELLILIPKGNGKTVLLAALGIYHLRAVLYPEVYIGAATAEQAKKMYFEASRFARQVEMDALPGYLEIRKTHRHFEDGFLRVMRSDHSDSGALEGIGPTLGLVDELHAHKNAGLYSAIQGALPKRDGQMLTISTAGSDEASVLGQIRKRALAFRDTTRADRLTIARSERFCMFEWALRDDDDRDDARVVKRANPASFVGVRKLARTKSSPSMSPARWARYHCGIWASGEGRWIDPADWYAAERDEALEDGDIVVLGYDHAMTYDHAALIALRPDGERSGHVEPLAIWRPEDFGGEGIPYHLVEGAIKEAAERFNVAALGYDRHGFKRSAEVLADEGLLMVAVDMGSPTWGPLTSELRAAIREQRLTHSGNVELTEHVVNGETKDSPHGERLHGRIPGRRKVDALMALGAAWFTAFSTAALEGRESVYEEKELVVL